VWHRIFKGLVLATAFALMAGISGYVVLTLIIQSEDTVITPDLVGKEVVASLEILSDLGLNTRVKGSEYNDTVARHHIIFQDPGPGTEIKRGRDVKIIISKGPKQVIMPRLMGLNITQARIILDQNDLCLGHISHTFRDEVAMDDVIAQVPAPGHLTLKGTCTDLLVSQGNPPKAYVMPDMTGWSYEQALVVIEKMGLNTGDVGFRFTASLPAETIVSHTPAFGQRVVETSAIRFVLNRPHGTSVGADEHGSRIRLFQYRLPHGFLKHHLRIRLHHAGLSNDLFDGWVKPAQEIWLLIPQGGGSTLSVYEDGVMVESHIYD